MACMKEVHEDLICSLASANLGSLSRLCNEFKLISNEVKKSFDSLDPDPTSLPLPRKIRYLLLHLYERLEGNPRLYDRWLKLLAEHGVSTQLLKLFTGHSAGEPVQDISSLCFMKTHVSALTEILASNSSRWFDIGVALNFPENALREIAALMHYQAGNPFTFSLTRLLNEWVDGKYKQAKPPTVENLRKALGSLTVGLGRMASTLDHQLMENEVFFKKNVSSLSLKEESVDVPLLEIIYQSCDVKVLEGKSTLLEVQVATAHKTTISYQWLKDDNPLKDDGKYFIGSNKQILCINNAILASRGIYTCKVEIAGERVVVQTEPVDLMVKMVVPTAENIIKMYSSSKREIKRSWPPAGNKAYVDLALVEHVKKVRSGDFGNIDVTKKDTVQYEAAFSEYKSAALVLIEGRPGSGKTTLVQKITKDWASGKFILKGSSLVLLVSLRGLAKKAKISMLDILQSVYNTNDSKCKALLHHLEDSFGEGVCFILDGLDEYACGRSQESTIYDIIERKYLQHSMVIVASRHSASKYLRDEASSCIEVVGFLNNQIFEYVNGYPFANELASAEELKAYLTEHPNILQMCYLPVHTVMISYLYSLKLYDLPETECGIYKYFTLYTVLRKIAGRGGTLKSLDELTGDNKECFERICKLAFDMTTSSHQVFEASELSLPATGDDQRTLGLVTVDFTGGEVGMENLYSFFHLTFQEFLAAYHISKLEEVKQMDVISQFGHEKQMKTVWKFFCGLVNFEDRGFIFEEILKLHDNDLFRCQCAFESQQPPTSRSVVCFGENGGLSFDNQSLHSSDFTSVCYVISNSVDIVKKLSLCKCDITDIHTNLACADVLKLCINLESLNLSINHFGDSGAVTLAHCFVRCKSLLTLNLSKNGISPEGARALGAGIKSCKNLQSLCLDSNQISDDGVQVLFDTGLIHCNDLESLNLAYNSISDVGVKPISEILNNCSSSLQELKVGGNDFSTAGTASLAHSVRICSCLI